MQADIELICIISEVLFRELLLSYKEMLVTAGFMPMLDGIPRLTNDDGMTLVCLMASIPVQTSALNLMFWFEFVTIFTIIHEEV